MFLTLLIFLEPSLVTALHTKTDLFVQLYSYVSLSTSMNLPDASVRKIIFNIVDISLKNDSDDRHEYYF